MDDVGTKGARMPRYRSRTPKIAQSRKPRDGYAPNAEFAMCLRALEQKVRRLSPCCRIAYDAHLVATCLLASHQIADVPEETAHRSAENM
jgi:hypothetical protein